MSLAPSLRSRAITVLAAAALVAGCGDRATPSPAPRSDVAASPSSSMAPSAVASGSPTSRSSSGQAAFDPSGLRIQLETVTEVPGGPLDVTSAGDDSGRLFVASQSGQIWIVRDGKRAPEPFLDISDQITSGGEQGLLGLAFHPGYPDDPHFFIDYTDRRGDTVVSRWTVSSDPDRADPGSEEVILRVDQPFANHNGGDVLFGPDGNLYVALGDGGSGGDPFGNGQNLDTHLGKILRIDVDHPANGRPYAIPSDNPFADRSNARPEIWLTGLRNPWRMSFDRSTRDFWMGDVGQGGYEEIDVVRSGSGGGQNFGWNIMEGFHCYPSGDSCDTDGLTLPVAEYSHERSICAVTGGYVYRGAASQALAGAYVFADYCSGEVWAIPADASDVRDPEPLLDSEAAISSFGEDDDGELYATDLRGALLRVTASRP